MKEFMVVVVSLLGMFHALLVTTSCLLRPAQQSRASDIDSRSHPSSSIVLLELKVEHVNMYSRCSQGIDAVTTATVGGVVLEFVERARRACIPL